MSAAILHLPTSTVQQSAAEYVALGWQLCVIPPGTKAPATVGWNQPGNGIAHSAQLPDDCAGMGLLHAWSNTCAIDLDNVELATLWLANHGVDLRALLDGDDAVQIQSGRENSGKLIFSLTTPMLSKRVTAEIDGMQKTILEFRSATSSGTTVQCVLPPSKHPGGTTYQWAGKGRYDALQPLPESLRKVWEELIEADQTPRVQVVGGHAASADEIASAVSHCNPDSDRMPWVAVGMGLKKELGDAGFPMWDEWSKQSTKYPGSREMGIQWASFKNSHPSPITVGTIFFHAGQNGWQRPPPDLGRMFKAARVKSYDQIMAEICPPVPRLDLGLFPLLLANYSREITTCVGCDPVVPVLAGLAAVSAAANKEMTLYVNKTFSVRPIIRCMTVGDPSERKTPGSKPMFSPLYKIEAEDKGLHQVRMLKWKGLEARHAGDMKAFNAWQQSPEAALPNAVPPAVVNLPPMPAELRLIITDATSQKAATMVASRPHGLLLYRDEAGNWLRRATDPRSGDDTSYWTSSYEGGFYHYDRQGSGSTPLPNNAISVYGNIQPSLLDRYLPELMIDGGHARFIFGVLNSDMDEVGEIDDLPDFMSYRGDYEEMIRVTHSLPAVEYKLSDDARQVLREWNQWERGASKHAKATGRGKLYEGAVGKVVGLALRVALLFHLMVDPYNLEVSAESMTQATRFVRDFVLVQFDYIDRANVGAKVQEWLTKYLTKHCLDERVSLSELRRVLEKNPMGNDMEKREKEERILTGMEKLATEGWVSQIEVKNAKTVHWAINSSLKVLLADRLKELKDEEAKYGYRS